MSSFLLITIYPKACGFYQAQRTQNARREAMSIFALRPFIRHRSGCSPLNFFTQITNYFGWHLRGATVVQGL